MANDIKKLRRLMYAANYLKRENPVILKGNPIGASRALKYAWWFEDFRKKLSTGVWRFSYFKKDGSIREAVGTLDVERIPEEKHPTGDPSDVLAPTCTFSYFDLDKNEWRSFCLDLFIGFVEQIS